MANKNRGMNFLYGNFSFMAISTKETDKKIGTRSIHVDSLNVVSLSTPNYNCTLLSIVTMLNTLHDRYFTGYAQTQTNCNAMFDVCKRTSF